MTYHVKREHLKNWDVQLTSDDLRFQLADRDDDDDIYISERSSITSSNDTGQLLSPMNKRLSTPVQSARRTPHSLRYTYNDLPLDGIPAAVTHQRKRKEAKKNLVRKAPPGHGALAPIPQNKPPDNDDNYYPYWYYYKLRNPDWITHQRHANPGQKIPYDSYDPTKYLPQGALTTSPIKPRKRAPKPRTLDSDRQRHDQPDKGPVVPLQPLFHHQQPFPSPRRFIPLKDPDNHEAPIKRKPLPERRKPKTDNEWADHYAQSVAHKQPHDLSDLVITSNPIVNRTKNPSRVSDKHFFTATFDEIDSHPHKVHARHPPKASHYHHHHHHHPPSEHSSQQSHHDDYHQQHLHIRRRSLSGVCADSEVQIVDVLYDEPQPPRYPPRAPLLYHQSNFLPPVTHKPNPTRFPAGYYGTLGRQLNSKPWHNPIGETKAYKSELHSRYYDNHLHAVIDKRLAV